jgi:GH43 family beta-xylosidase
VRPAVAAVLGLLVGLVGAATVGVGPAAAAEPEPPAAPGQRLPTRGPVRGEESTGRAEPLDLLGGLLLGHPIIRGDFADPYALSERDAVYVYATNTVDANVPVVELPKGGASTGRYLGDAMPHLPSWTGKGFQWAPAVWARPDGRFVLYYATSAPQSTRMCISRATADSPAGPFEDDSSGPFICPLDKGGAIDPSVIVHEGDPYLVWKADGNCCQLPTEIYSQRLSKDGLSVVGAPTKLIDADQSWEKGVVEGPSMVRDGDRYLLFYSANNWDSTDYAIGVATCASIEGPCTKTLDRPWMRSGGDDEGPGGEEFFEAPTGDGIWMVHHGWLPHQAGTADGQRRLYLERVSFHGGSQLPTRTTTQAVEEALLEDAGFLALLVGLAVGLGAAGVLWWRRRRHHQSQSQKL